MSFFEDMNDTKLGGQWLNQILMNMLSRDPGQGLLGGTPADPQYGQLDSQGNPQVGESFETGNPFWEDDQSYGVDYTQQTQGLLDAANLGTQPSGEVKDTKKANTWGNAFGEGMGAMGDAYANEANYWANQENLFGDGDGGSFSQRPSQAYRGSYY